MSHHRMGLSTLLASGGPDFGFKLVDRAQVNPQLALTDVPGALVRERELLFVWHDGSRTRKAEIEPVYDGPRTAQHEVLRLCDLHPHGIWIARLSPGAPSGTLIPFTPPRVTRLNAAVPLYVPPDQRELASDVGLVEGKDALRPLRLQLGHEAVVIVGQRGLAALSEQDGRKLTLWMPSGDAVEAQVERTADRARLVFLGVVSAVNAREAHCGPNLIVRPCEDAALPVVHEDAVSATAEALDVFMPKRSPLLQTWLFYAQLEHELSEKRLQARLQSPLDYSDAHQHKKLWQVTIALTEEQRRAWLGADPETHHEVQVDQQVELDLSGLDQHQQEQEGRLVVWRMRAEGAGVVRATLRPQRGFRHLPERGRLRAVENIGTKVERERRKDALELLQAGRAACPNLMDLLSDPASAELPQAVRLRPTHLDESQRRALEKIVGCADLVAIQGPPGTGKTSVIVEVLLNLAGARQRGEAKRVLVSSVQNEAIDNVAERLAREGILVHQIRRESQDEDEAFQQAAHRDQTRTDILQKLEKSLEGKQRLTAQDRLRERMLDLDRLRVIRSDERALLPLANEISDFCVGAELPTVVQEEGHRLCRLLRDQALRPEQPTVPAAVPAQDIAPASPDATQSWWEARKDLWPTATRAAVEAAVRAVISAAEGARQNPMRHGPRRDRLFADLLKLLSQVGKAPLAQPEPAPDAAPDPVDTWLDRVEQELRLRERELFKYPEVIARRFLERLREDPAAWRQIQRRHSQTTTATCSMSAQARDLGEDPYDLVIIDEAGRATPLELLVPMVQGKRVALIGDHRQLPPLLEDEVITAVEREQTPSVDLSTTTLFGEIFENLPSSCTEQLSIQYRMHEQIGQLVSRLFYKPHGQKLRSHFTGERARERLPDYGVLDDAPITLLDTQDEPGPSPYENRSERRTVLALLTAFMGSARVRGLSTPLRIGVICAYARQRDLLIEDFDRLRAKDPEPWSSAPLQIEIKTIDAVQGREYPVTIVCLVRRDGRPGFLAAPNRINVALSRAQRQLIVLTTPDSLNSLAMRERASHMPKLVDYCRELCRIKRWDEVRL